LDYIILKGENKFQGPIAKGKMEGLVLGGVGVKMRIHQVVICTSRDQETPALHILKTEKYELNTFGHNE
jgi:hypothetical protein